MISDGARRGSRGPARADVIVLRPAQVEAGGLALRDHVELELLQAPRQGPRPGVGEVDADRVWTVLARVLGMVFQDVLGSAAGV